jgi:hypothetical protein
MSQEIEDDITEGCAMWMIMEAELVTWCQILNSAELPPIMTAHAD